jgi:hypothetical protein
MATPAPDHNDRVPAFHLSGLTAATGRDKPCPYSFGARLTGQRAEWVSVTASGLL